MISSRLSAYFQHPAAREAKREYSVKAAFTELHQEQQLFEQFSQKDNQPGIDHDPTPGRLELRQPAALGAPNQRQIAQWSGSSQRGLMERDESLMLDNDQQQLPNFHTSTRVRLHPFGMEKLSATETAEGVHVRKSVVDVESADYCYTETFFIAR